jgi:2-keto-4-pentenoate hydratase/2-oxohepta-3-ene-1,7-dioic acid hydratase in catechol pathway
MRICRYGGDRIGVVRDERVYDVTDALADLPAMRWPLPVGDRFVADLDALRPRIEELADRAPSQPLAETPLLSPIANPSKIVGAPVNYRRHLDEVRVDAGLHHGTEIKPIERIGLFLKAVSSLAGPSEGVALRFPERRNDHEVELVVVIGRTADRVARADALDYVAGYTIGLDMTVRGPEERSMRKSVDSYCVLGPCLVTAEEVADPGTLDLELRVGGETRQKSNTRNLVFDVPKLIELASSFYTLHPGDVIMTGTPEGVGPVQPGDVLEASIAGLGSMRVEVRAA